VTPDAFAQVITGLSQSRVLAVDREAAEATHHIDREPEGLTSMKITYDTVTDSISCPDLSPEQTRQLQSELSAALVRNDPVQTVARNILAKVTQGGQQPA
jgi:hypothetical protein